MLDHRIRNNILSIEKSRWFEPDDVERLKNAIATRRFFVRFDDRRVVASAPWTELMQPMLHSPKRAMTADATRAAERVLFRQEGN